MEQSLIQGDNQQERLSFLKGYMMGLIDGEGYVTLGRVNALCHDGKYRIAYVPQIGIVNTSEKMIEYIHALLKEFNIPHYISKRNRKALGNYNRKPIYQVAMIGYKRCKKFITVFGNQLVEKKEKLNFLLQLIDSRLTRKTHKQPFTNYELSLVAKIRESQIKNRNLESSTTNTPNPIKG